MHPTTEIKMDDHWTLKLVGGAPMMVCPSSNLSRGPEDKVPVRINRQSGFPLSLSSATECDEWVLAWVAVVNIVEHWALTGEQWELVEAFQGKHKIIPRQRRAKRPKKPPSRPQRWREAVSQAQSAVETLKELQSEYEEWYDNLPENLQEGATAEKLEAVLELCIDDLDDTLNECEEADLPRGFGKD
jgi:hypothetical protein